MSPGIETKLKHRDGTSNEDKFVFTFNRLSCIPMQAELPICYETNWMSCMFAFRQSLVSFVYWSTDPSEAVADDFGSPLGYFTRR